MDETWLGMADFRRIKWQPKSMVNSLSFPTILPMISMIVGLDTEGLVYFSLTQANFNALIVEIFFRQLVAKLDQEDKEWRRDTIVLKDNAKYHCSAHTLRILESLKVPTMFLGPYSFSAAPCELLFAHFKKSDINPRRLATSKG